MALVVKKFNFSAAHFLPNYIGACSRIHGHTWFVDVGIEGKIDLESGMVIDFTEIKRVINPLIEVLDHHILNDVMRLPTAENIGLWIYKNLGYEVGKNIKFIRVWESPEAYAEVTLDDCTT
jgi:6-pyruvoyltetrahydropterin/6-carboxytetrahydropterin synthase